MGFTQAEFTLESIIITMVAAFLAGVINAIAGGGSFFAFPALVFIGVPGIMANATSALAVLPGYIGGSVGFRQEIAGFDRRALSRFCVIAIIGAFIGASLLMMTSSRVFEFIIPLLLIFGTFLFTFSHRLVAALKSMNGSAPDRPIVHPHLCLFLVAIYGGYFNGGLGILLLALFAIMGLEDIHMMNGLKSVLSFVISVISAISFSLVGLVDWRFAAIMMLAASLGGYMGADWSRLLPPVMTRNFIIMVGVVLSLVFIYRLF